MHQNIRPLKLIILNLMPTKIVTETQLLRKLANTPLQIQVELLQTASYTPQHIDQNHLSTFYRTFAQVKHSSYDGMIITGAPVENLDFSDVDYWDELCEIMEWTKTHVHATLHICWGAQAGLFYHYGIEKYTLPKKMFGVFSHKVVRTRSPWFRGFDDTFTCPTPATPPSGKQIFWRSPSCSCWLPLTRPVSSPLRAVITAVSLF